MTSLKPATTAALPHQPSLDGVRAIAVIGVVAFHSLHLDGGFLGVDLFFALSGYLITTLLLREHARTGRIALGAFWGRRARRLLPAMALVVTATLLAIAVLFGSESVAANRDEAIASLLSVENWYTLHAAPPFLTVFQHLWSLSIEGQFYVIWPLVAIVALGRAGGDSGRSDLETRPQPTTASGRLLAVALGGALLSSLAMILLHDGPDTLARVYSGTDTRATPILLGAAWACATERWGDIAAGPKRVALDLSGWIALAAIIVTWVVVTRPTNALYEGGSLLYSLAAVVFVAAAAHPVPATLTGALSVLPLRALGLISYGVYLWHWPIFYLATPGRIHLEGWPLLGVQLAATIAIATASYVFVETPIRQRRFPFTRATA